MDPSALLRPGLLADRVVALGGGSALGPPLAALGATAAALPPTLDEDDAAERARAAVAAHGRVDVLLHDLRPQFAGGPGHDDLRAALDTAWVAIRAVANAAWIDAGREACEGRVLLIAPPPGRPAAAAAPPASESPAAEPHAAAVRAATENLARTLSIEWSRHGIRTVAITPGDATGDAQLAAVAAYLASPAGDYFSGCVLALDEVAVAPAPA